MEANITDYLTKAMLLTEDEKRQLLFRMNENLVYKFQNQKVNLEEALALQLRFEYGQLQNWREQRQMINAQAEKKLQKKVVELVKTETVKPKAQLKIKNLAAA